MPSAISSIPGPFHEYFLHACCGACKSRRPGNVGGAGQKKKKTDWFLIGLGECSRAPTTFVPCHFVVDMTSTPSPGSSTSRKNHDAFGDDFISFDMEDEYDESASPPAPVVVDDSVREHASARSTPWAQHVPWHQCRNVSEMYVCVI